MGDTAPSLKMVWLREIVDDESMIEHRLLILLVVGVYMNRDGVAIVNTRLLSRKINITQKKIESTLSTLGEEGYIDLDWDHPELRSKHAVHITAILMD